MNPAEESQNNYIDYRLNTHFKNEKRKISDPIYDFIYFDQDIWKVIDNPVFQRLRNIKQLGTTSWVFQGANHTRFEHCLGVGYLAQQFITAIYKNYPSQDFEEDKSRNIKLVTIAGIVHDLGHGPFSHMFDNLLIPKLTNYQETWTHEVASERLFDYICDQYGLGLPKDDIQFVNALIHGDKDKVSNGKKQWFYDIVSNKRNGIDVDRLDYIRRDCHHLGWPNYLKDFHFLMDESKVIDDEICYPQKYALNIFDFFNTRYKLYKTIYLNRISQAIEQMMCDILISVNDHYKFQEIIHQPEKYYKLNDTIIEQIDCSDNPQFEKAQKIIARLKTRDLYKFVAEALVEEKIHLDSNEKIKDEIFTYLPSSAKIDYDEFYVSSGKIGFGSKNSNPIGNVNFYKKSTPDQKFILQNELMSYCLPVQYSEKFIRVFVSNSAAIQPIEEAFGKFCKNKLGLTPQNQDKTLTPIKQVTSFEQIKIGEKKEVEKKLFQ